MEAPGKHLMNLQSIVRWAVVAVLLHSLLVGPLLVVCVRTDGQVLIELDGCDPCRQNQPGCRHSGGPAPAGQVKFSENNITPCVDVSCFQPAASQSGLSFQLTLCPGMVALAGAGTADVFPSDIGGDKSLLPEIIFPHRRLCQTDSPIRI